MADTLYQVEQQGKSLQEQNFDLKMAVYHLEEKLEKIAASGRYSSGVVGNVDVVRNGGGHGHDEEKGNMDRVVEEHAQQRLLLDEKTLELEERDTVLVKARTAIEQLQKELRGARAEITRLRERPDQSDLQRTTAELSVVERERDDLALEKSRLEQALVVAQQSARAAKVDATEAARRATKEEVDRRLTEQGEQHKQKLKHIEEDLASYRKEIIECRKKVENSNAEVVAIANLVPLL